MKTKHEIIDFLKSELNIAIIKPYLPLHILEDYKNNHPKKTRQRLYSMELVLQAMIYQSLAEDKSEQNAVMFIHEYYMKLQKEIETKQKELMSAIMEEQQSDIKKKQGRPRKHLLKVQKSKLKEISLNTSSYDQARQRFPLEVLEEMLKSIRTDLVKEKPWHGHQVYIADGTTAKTVDTKELREHFMPKVDKNPQPLPLMRIEGLINLYGGYLVDVEISDYSSSEGQMIKKLYRSIPEDTVLLADDLYSSYGHFAFCQTKGVYLISQGKHKRTDKIVKIYSKNDVIVEWRWQQRPAWFTEEDELPKTMQVRRISYKDPEHPEKMAYIYTNLIDPEKYPAMDILALYLCRWDIELSFREIKIVLNMEYLRSKTVAMVMKEVLIYLILYNIIKIIMIKSIDKNDIDFFSHGETVQSSNTIYQKQDAYIDRLGRTYARKSPGRNGYIH